MRTSTCRCWLLSIGCAVVALACQADTLVLRDGTEYEGEIVRQDKDTVTFRIRLGGMKGSVVLPKSEIVLLQTEALRPDPIIAGAESMLKEAQASQNDPRKTAESWVKLGEYYHCHPGYAAQAHNAYVQALLWDCDNATARSRLGYVKTALSWERPRPKPAAPAQAQAPKAANAEPGDAIVIGLRRDEDLINKLLDEQAARRRAEQELSPRQDPGYGGYLGFYGRDNTYFAGYGNLVVGGWPYYSNTFWPVSYGGSYSRPSYTGPGYGPQQDARSVLRARIRSVW